MAHAASSSAAPMTTTTGGSLWDDSGSEDSVFSIYDNDTDDNTDDADDADDATTATTATTATIGLDGESQDGGSDDNHSDFHSETSDDDGGDGGGDSGDSVKCTFCFNRLQPRKRPSPIPLFTVDSCGHQFHFRCMQSWLLTRQHVNDEKLRRCVTCQQVIIFNEPICQMFFEMVLESRRHRPRRRRHRHHH